MYTLKDFLIALHSLEPEKQKEIKEWQRKYPLAYQYLVFYPFFKSQRVSREVCVAAESLLNKHSTFLRFYEVFNECDSLDYFDEIVEELAATIPHLCRLTNSNIRYKIHTLKDLL